VGWDPSPDVLDREIQGALGSDGYRAGGRVMAQMGLVLENSLYFPQLDELADFANAVPDLTIVLNHVGGLLRVGPYANRDDEVLAEWRRGVAAAAKCPNIIMKLGGAGQARYGYDWAGRDVPVGSEELAGTLAPLMNHCIEQFGADRCMFESNFPVDKISYSYNVIFNAFKRLSQSYSPSERAAMFHDTAKRVYSIDV
jgi:predicted TIM-barrel fold metal-dependent hydrolase